MVGQSNGAGPLVSVIVPVYNTPGEWLRPCLESIRGQNYQNLEVIMVDDGSTEGDTTAVCEEYARRDSRFSHVRRANGGLSAARNTGLEHARGEWITMVDADDMLHPRAVEILLGMARENGATIAVGRYQRGSKPRWKALGSERRVAGNIVNGREAVIGDLYQHRVVHSAWGALYHRSLFLPEGARYREGTWYEDLDIFYRLYLGVQKVVIYDEPLYFYRRTPGSFITSFSAGRFDAMDVTDRMVGYMEQIGDAELIDAAQSRQFAAHYNAWLLLRKWRMQMPEGKYEKLVERCRNVIVSRRGQELTGRGPRMKNRVGALLSYLFISRNTKS